jgi:hypothetical protein
MANDLEQEGKIMHNHPASALLKQFDKEDRQTAAAKTLAESLNIDQTFMPLKSGGNYDKYSAPDLWHVACLFAGIDPQHACAREVWLRKNGQHTSGAASVAVKNLFTLYDVAKHERVGTDGKVRLGAFELWARKEGFTCSTIFSNSLKAESSPDCESAHELQFDVVEAVGVPGSVEPDKAGPVVEKPWEVREQRDPEASQEWYTPARYFARQLVIKDSTLLQKRSVLAGKVSLSLAAAGFKKRGGKKNLESGTVLKAFSNVVLG